MKDYKSIVSYENSIDELNDIFEDTFVDENFPEKDRSRSYRRKKTYFKGRKRYNRIYQKGFTPFSNTESIIKGMMRKTNIVRVYSPNDPTRQRGFNRSNLRRIDSANYKLCDCDI